MSRGPTTIRSEAEFRAAHGPRATGAAGPDATGPAGPRATGSFTVSRPMDESEIAFQRVATAWLEALRAQQDAGPAYSVAAGPGGFNVEMTIPAGVEVLLRFEEPRPDEDRLLEGTVG